MNESIQRVEQYIEDGARHYRGAVGWYRVLVVLTVVLVVLVFVRGFWPPSPEQLQQRDASGTPAG